MKKTLILLLILASILFYLIYQSCQFKIDSSEKIFHKDVKYYDNNINIDKVLSDKLRYSGTLEEELVNDMKIDYNKSNNNDSPNYQPLLPSLEGTTNIEI